MTTIAPIVPGTTARRAGEVDNLATYLSFGLAYVVGHGAAAVSHGADPLVRLPGWLPLTLLGIGLAVGTVNATIAATRAQRGAGKPEALAGKLLGAAWITGFTALFLAITGLSAAIDHPELQAMLWPAGSSLVVGLLYLAEGVARRNALHYTLGTCLVLVAGVSFLFGTPGLFWILAVVGGFAYAVAAVLERRRLARV
ncbi:ABC transporter permease [Amycolatopsis magusensis]|uniref:ABC transporter permease n=1 Tax=Amycolatopsis magusensis TaxID=882444 RepID=A0ABS4PQC2_9PSEU|nr:ABC transporter permease [Amycolatopsis magusensis]MBP2181609.1 hypothetical protein [Amycolatopsis magusensis]